MRLRGTSNRTSPACPMKADKTGDKAGIHKRIGNDAIQQVELIGKFNYMIRYGIYQRVYAAIKEHPARQPKERRTPRGRFRLIQHTSHQKTHTSTQLLKKMK